MKQKPKADTRYVRKDGRVSQRFRDVFRLVADDYRAIISFLAARRQKPLTDYQIRNVYVVGSTLEGSDESDLDLLLIASHIDDFDFRFIKQAINGTFFYNRQKCDAIDIYVRPYDEFPERVSFEVTDQLENILAVTNKALSSNSKH